MIQTGIAKFNTIIEQQYQISTVHDIQHFCSNYKFMYFNTEY